MRYTSGSVKKGKRTYYYIKNTETGQIEPQCTKYLKHKVMQNRAANTVIRIAGILPFYMDFLADRDLTLSSVAAMKFADQSEHLFNFSLPLRNVPKKLNHF